MIHTLLALTLAWGFLSPGYAQSPFDQSPRPAAAARVADWSEPQMRILITEKTVIFLDGQPCRYDRVPRGAVITFAELDSDRETVLSIHYRSPR